MGKIKKITTWLIRSLLVFIIFIVVAMALAPGLINLETVRENIEDKISHDVGGEIKYQRLQLSYFPRPHVAIFRAQVVIPNGFTVAIHRMKIYPKIFALLKGNLEVAVVKLQYADYFMKLPQIREASPHPGGKQSLDDIIDTITTGAQDLPKFKLPELNLKIEHGKVNLVDPFGHKFKLRQVQAGYQFSADKVEFTIKCKSNLWDQVDIKGWLNPSDFRGRGHIQLSQFRPQSLFAYLFPQSALQATESKANFTIGLESDGTGNIRSDINGAVPLLVLNHGSKKLNIKDGRIQGSIRIGKKTVSATLTELGFDYPKLNVTGMFSYGRNQQNNQLTIKGTRIDAVSVRQVALALMGESKTVRNIFKVVRAGRIPGMTVRIQGQTLADLSAPDNIVIEGRMTQGRIFIPGVELNLEDVIGDAVISKGTLQGKNLQARTGNSHGQHGKMTLGLNGKQAPFRLKIRVNADLSQLPPFLGRTVKSKGFLNELDLIKNLKGSAAGILTLSGNLKNIKAKVEVSKAHLTARYLRIPFPVTIDGGHFVYAGTKLAFDNFSADVGKSSFSQVSSSIIWTGIPNLKVKSKTANFDLAQLYSWLLSFDTLQIKVKNIKSVNGNAFVQNLKIEGPFFSPADWNFQTNGAVENLFLSSKKLPGPFQVTKSGFIWQGSQIAFDDLDASVGKSEVYRLSAVFDWNKASSLNVHAKSVKLDTDEIYPWLSSLEKFQPVFKNFSIAGGILILNEVNLTGPFQQPDQWRYQMACKIQNLILTSDAFGDPVTINSGTFHLTSETSSGVFQNTINVQTAALTWENHQLTLQGAVTLAKNDILLDMVITADTMNWYQVKDMLDFFKKRKTNSDSPTQKGHLLGTIIFQTDNFNYKSYSLRPLQTEIELKPDKAMITVKQADICSISFRGLLEVSEQTLEMNLIPTAANQKLAPAISCITNQNELATGTYNLNGELMAKSRPDAFRQSLSGKVELLAQKGRIYRFGLLAKILAILNVTEIYRGQIPDLTGEGFAYRSITAGADIKEGKLIMKECSIDGLSMGIACEGNIDFANNKMDLIILVAPFKTADRIIDFIPLIGHVLGGKLISIPFRAKGGLKDPDVIPLSPTAVGSGVLGILERTLKLPITIMQPLFSGGKNRKNGKKN